MKNLKSIPFITLVLMILISSSIFATTPYRAYSYNYWGRITEMPNPYLPYAKYEKDDFGSIGLNSPSDMFYDNNGYVYIVDTGNNRIVILDTEFNFVNEIATFNAGDKFNKPTGIFVDDEGKIFVCDSLNNRVVILDDKGKLLSEIKEIESNILPDNFIFVPQKIVVDRAGRIYILAQNVFEGIMSFDENGEFTGYFGTINVSYNPIEIFWRRMATEEQRAKMLMFIPTEFISMDIDEKGFIYTTELPTNNQSSVKKLNPSGKNVLINYSPNEIEGDLITRGNTGSYFIDIDITEIGIYTALDRTNGRIFTYDSEGNNLYTYGVIGNEEGNFKSPVAIENIDGKVAVLDSQLNRVIVFEPTYFGSLINEAIDLRYNGDESEAVEIWKEVLTYNAHYEIANKGIGKAYLSDGDNVNAMYYLKLGYDKKNYSIAFKRYRNEILRENLESVLVAITVLVAVYFGFKFYKKYKVTKKNKGRKEGNY